MALLPPGSIDEIHAIIMRRLSAAGLEVPATKSDLRALVVILDEVAEFSDARVINQIPQQHPGRQWLIDNPRIARQMKELVEHTRAEDL